MSKITKISKKGLNLIKSFEGLSLKPYLCPAKIPTLGYGNTFYPNGIKVKMTDPSITEERASEMLLAILKHYETVVDSYVRDDINQSQFDALVSFAYNCGIGNLKSSTLLKKVNANPKDETIVGEFMKWNKGGGKVLSGLTRRRTAEANLYFS
jgi:lysozyme